MTQQLLALAIILFFVFKVFTQRKKKQIPKSEFFLWLFFWLAIALAIVFIKKIDSFVARIGFSAAGIEVLLYLAVAWLFYAYFRIRIKIEKVDKNITKIIRKISLDE